MDEAAVQQIFTELFEALEPLDTQISGLLQFLKSKGIATEEELAPFLEQAGNASNIRWLAARLRTDALISSALKPAEKSAGPDTAENSTPASKIQRDGASRESRNADHSQESDKTRLAEEESRENLSSQKQAESSPEQKEPAQKEKDDSGSESNLSDPPLFKRDWFEANKTETTSTADSPAKDDSKTEAA
jgi:hypothetical protein